MPRSQPARKRHCSSFIKFVARLQRALSSKNVKSSTPVLPQQLCRQYNSGPIPRFPSFSDLNYPRCRLSQVIYDPSRQVEYLSEIEEKTSSERSTSAEDFDSCYNSMSDHRKEQFNLSQMNVSNDDTSIRRSQPLKLLMLPNTLDTARFHSTAINEKLSY